MCFWRSQPCLLARLPSGVFEPTPVASGQQGARGRGPHALSGCSANRWLLQGQAPMPVPLTVSVPRPMAISEIPSFLRRSLRLSVEHPAEEGPAQLSLGSR